MREVAGIFSLIVTGSASPAWMASLFAFGITFLVLYSRLRRDERTDRLHYDG